jgi:hypothetical protein
MIRMNKEELRKDVIDIELRQGSDAHRLVRDDYEGPLVYISGGHGFPQEEQSICLDSRQALTLLEWLKQKEQKLVAWATAEEEAMAEEE